MYIIAINIAVTKSEYFSRRTDKTTAYVLLIQFTIEEIIATMI